MAALGLARRACPTRIRAEGAGGPFAQGRCSHLRPWNKYGPLTTGQLGCSRVIRVAAAGPSATVLALVDAQAPSGARNLEQTNPSAELGGDVAAQGPDPIRRLGSAKAAASPKPELELRKIAMQLLALHPNPPAKLTWEAEPGNATYYRRPQSAPLRADRNETRCSRLTCYPPRPPPISKHSP